MVTNLAINAIVVPFQTAVPHLTKYLTKSHRVIYKRKKIEKFQRKGRRQKGRRKFTVIKEQNEIIKERMGNLDKR